MLHKIHKILKITKPLNNRLSILSVVVALAIFVTVCGFSTIDYSDTNRAKYICAFIRHVTWHNNETKLIMGVLDKDTEFVDEMSQLSVSENLAGKTLTVVLLNSLENLPELHLLYVNKNLYPNVKIDSLMAVAQANRFLLITEASDFHQSMVNFVVLENMYFEINEEALEQAGFGYSEDMSLASIKNRKDWETLYREALTDLEMLRSEIDENLFHLEELRALLRMHQIIIVLSVLIIIILAVFGVYAYRNYKKKQQINRLLEAQNEEITVQLEQIARQNREITDSLIYAQRIQNAVLPTSTKLRDYVDMFIFYRPRDIVSGDFYWMSKKEDKLVIVAADCTGHGVPGAFMSMLGVSFLNEIVNKEHEMYANEILNKLRESVIRSLNQAGHDEYIHDGMDVALCVIDYPSMTLQYAGAHNPLILVRNGELTEIKADKMPVAYCNFRGNKEFTNRVIPLLHDDCIYMFSDGYADQFGGSEEITKKYSSKRLRHTLLEIAQLSTKEQEKKIVQHYDQWKGSQTQTDDVLLIGIKV